MPNAKAVGKVIGVLITNSRFKKLNYKFREQEDLTNFKNPVTIQSERDEAHKLFDCFKINERRCFEDPTKDELVKIFKQLKTDAT